MPRQCLLCKSVLQRRRRNSRPSYFAKHLKHYKPVRKELCKKCLAKDNSEEKVEENNVPLPEQGVLEEAHFPLQATSAKDVGTVKSVDTVLESHQPNTLLVEDLVSPRRVTGLLNLGNTCFMNAVLQCLASIPSLVKPATTEALLCKQEYYEVYHALLALMRSMSSSIENSVSPEDFVKSFCAAFKDFKLGVQSDAFDFITFLFRVTEKYGNVEKTHKISEEVVTKCCKCAKISTTEIPEASCISVPIPQDQVHGRQLCLADCLALYSAPGQVESYTCPAGCFGNAEQQIKIAKTSGVLIVHLKRFVCSSYGEYEKNFDFISCPHTLTIQKKTYSLRAVVNHLGDRGGGHYTSSCFIGGKWFLFDDDAATEIATADVVSAAAYVLFYEEDSKKLDHPMPEVSPSIPGSQVGFCSFGNQTAKKTSLGTEESFIPTSQVIRDLYSLMIHGGEGKSEEAVNTTPSTPARNGKQSSKPQQSSERICAGRAFQSQLQNAICRVYDTAVKATDKIDGVSPISLTARILGVSEKSVQRYVEKRDRGSPFKTPGKKRRKTAQKRGVDSFTKNAIRRLIYEHRKGKKHFTLKTLLQTMKERNIPFVGEEETLRLVLHDMGFRYSRKNNRRYLMELPQNVAQRCRFVREYMRYKEEGLFTFLWLDETWTFRHGSFTGKEWQSDSKESCSATQANNGQRYIVLHCGGEEGWVPGASLVFKSKNNDGDYHGEMNGENFITWCSIQLGPNITSDTVLILDNASYHKVKLQADTHGGTLLNHYIF